MKSIIYILIITFIFIEVSICTVNSIEVPKLSSPLPLYLFNSFNLTIYQIDTENGYIKPYFSLEQELDVSYSGILYINSSEIYAYACLDNGATCFYQYINIDELTIKSITLPNDESTGNAIENSFYNPNTNLIYLINGTSIYSMNPVTYQQTNDVNIAMPTIILQAFNNGGVDTVLDTNTNLFYVEIIIPGFLNELDYSINDSKFPCPRAIGCNYLIVYDLNKNEMSSSLKLKYNPISLEVPISYDIYSTSILSIQSEPKTGNVVFVDFNPINGNITTLYKSDENGLNIFNIALDTKNQIIYLLNEIDQNKNYTLSTYSYQTNKLSTIFLHGHIPGTLLRVGSP